MNLQFSIKTKSLDYLPAAHDVCRICNQSSMVDEEGLCSACSEAVEECAICHSEYSISDEYEDVNVCQRCNTYYTKYRKALSLINALKNDILSLYADKKSQGMIDAPSRNLFREIMKMVFNARKTID